MKRSHFPYAASQHFLKHQPTCYTHVAGLIICNSKQLLSRQQCSWEMQTTSLRRGRYKPKLTVQKVTRDLQSIPQRHKGEVQSGRLVDTDPWQVTKRTEKFLEAQFSFFLTVKIFCFNIWLFPPALRGKDRTIHWALTVFPKFKDPQIEHFGKVNFSTEEAKNNPAPHLHCSNVTLPQ